MLTELLLERDDNNSHARTYCIHSQINRFLPAHCEKKNTHRPTALLLQEVTWVINSTTGATGVHRI